MRNEISQSGTWRLKMRTCFWIYEGLLEHVKKIRTHMSQLSISFCKPASIAITVTYIAWANAV